MASAGSLLRTLLLCSPLIGLPALASAELFISEYIEGSSNNKAIEIHNSGNAAVDLAAGAYRLQYFFNGSSGTGLTIDLTGSVAAGDVYVIAQSSADAAILAQADQTDGSGWFNGDDAIELQKNSVIIDSIGQVGFDPGSEWGSDLTSTADNTLRRKATICFGDTDSSDVFNPATEWDGFATNTFAGLGAHSATCAPRINEFVANHTGTDTHEFIEIIGLPSTDLSTHTVLHVEGDGTGAGTIDSAYTVGTTDANGFWTTGFLANGLENGSISLLLVRGFSGSVGNDLDTDDDGTLDSTPWIALADDVAVDDGGADDRHYSTTVLAANYDGQAFAPGGASRIPDAMDTDTTSDWVRNDFDGAGLPGFAGTLAPGEALNTPGTSNALTSPLPPFACGNEVTLISAVQGDGASSPLAGETVDIEAIVAAVFQGAGTLGGLFVQEEDTDADANPQTSEGLFVFTGQPAAVGDQVRVRGVATEFFDLTELSPVLDLEICSSGNPLPAATTIALPKTSEDAFEPFENMRVTLPDDLVVNDVFTLWRFGEFTVSSVRRRSPTQVVSPGAPALAQAASNALDQLIVDDGRTPQNLVVSHTGQDDVNPFAADNPIRSGQTISGLAGVMHYAFGVYRLQPTAPFINDETANPRTAAPNPVGGTLTVASFNVLNYFATLDGSGPICGPALDQDCRGADSAGELTRQTDKLVAALAAIDAGVVGLIELENDAGNALATLVDALNAAMGAGTYDYIDTGTIGSDAIKQGLIYKPASVTPEGDFALLTSAVDARFNDALNRPALAQTFRANDNLALFTVAVNHFKSKGSDCNALGDPDIGDGQGNCNLTRASAAAALADWLNGDPTGTGAGNTLILGDLNSYPMEDPLATLEGAGFTNLAAAFEGGGSYSFSFNGEAGSLDYALGNAAFTAQATGATSWHINADEAVALDYNEEFGKPAQYYLPDPYHASDHDPIIVGLDLNPPAMVTVPTTEPGVEAEVSISGGGVSCSFSAIEFIDPDSLSPPPAPNLVFPYGVLQFTAVRCDVGATVTIEVTLPPIPDFLAWFKFLTASGWAVYPSTLAGTTFSFELTDGGMGDADGLANGQIVDPSGPAVAVAGSARATFFVTKDFSDDNPAEVEVLLSCNTGLPLEQMSAIAEGGHVNFVVGDFDPGELDCSVSEVPVDGYSPDHAASFGATGIAGSATSGTDACTFLDVVDGRLNCAITNTLDEVTVTVNKTWITEGAGTELVEDVFVTLYCSGHDGAVGSAWINPDHPGEFEVLPDHAGETCHVEEQPLDGVETDVSDCAGLAIAPGSDDECTVVNTRFFEGIPTLAPAGLGLLALLLLGVGLLGLHRLT